MKVEPAILEAALVALEGKVTQVVGLCESLRAENRRLHARVVSLEAEKQTMTERMDTARIRLTNLMEKLPAE